MLQAWTLVGHYLSEPVTVDTGGELAGDEDAPFPAFTVCDSNRLNRSVAAAWGVLNSRGTTVKWRRFPWARQAAAVFWEAAAPRLSRLVPHCNNRQCQPAGDDGGDSSQGRWTVGRYRRGLCYTFRPTAPLVYRKDRRLALTLYSNPAEHTLSGSGNTLLRPDVDLFIHGSAAPVVDADFEDVEVSTHLTVAVGSVVLAQLRASRWQRLSLRRRPCQPASGYSRHHCLLACRWTERARAVGCRPPWSATPRLLPLCSEKADFLGMLFKEFRVPAADPCRSRCLKACTSTEYHLRVTSQRTNQSSLLRDHRAVVVLQWPYTLRVAAERSAYGLPELLSALGGAISLLLGVSVVSTVQLAETGARRLAALCLRRGQTTAADT